MGGTTTAALSSGTSGSGSSLSEPGSFDPGSIAGGSRAGRIAATVLVLFTALLNLLVPFERGVPLVRLGPLAIMFPVLFNLLAFGVLLFTRPIRTLRGFLHPPLFWQALVTLLILVRGFLSPEMTRGIATGLLYGATWVALFALMLTVLDSIGRPAFARAYLSIAAIGAILGIIEGLFGYVLPPYMLVRLVQALAQGDIAVSYVGRVDGPPGNSILFAFMMALSVPFAFEIQTRAIRWTLVAMFVLAIALSIARVGFLMLLVIALGGLLMGGKGARAAAIGLGLVLLTGTVVAIAFSSTPTVQRISDRLSGKGEAASNVRFRTEAVRLAVDRTFDEDQPAISFWGAGIRQGDKVGQSVAASVRTLDNAYVTLLYEGGFLLLFTYGVAHLFHLRRLWTGYGPARLYWFGVLAGLSGGVAFVSVYTVGPNFPFVATLAVLGHERLVRQRARKAAARATLAPAPAALA